MSGNFEPLEQLVGKHIVYSISVKVKKFHIFISILYIFKEHEFYLLQVIDFAGAQLHTQ